MPVNTQFKAGRTKAKESGKLSKEYVEKMIGVFEKPGFENEVDWWKGYLEGLK